MEAPQMFIGELPNGEDVFVHVGVGKLNTLSYEAHAGERFASGNCGLGTSRSELIEELREKLGTYEGIRKEFTFYIDQETRVDVETENEPNGIINYKAQVKDKEEHVIRGGQITRKEEDLIDSVTRAYKNIKRRERGS